MNFINIVGITEKHYALNNQIGYTMTKDKTTIHD